MSVRKLYQQNKQRYYILYYLFPVFAVLWTQFAISGITQINHHLFETVFYSAFVYYLMFLMLKEPPEEKDKYRFTGIDESASLEIFRKITYQIREKELYLDPDISLNTLARKVTVQVNVLSQAINQNAGLNFRDFINTFRIEKAQKEIPEKIHKGFTIASIAYDCGFNSLSAFNRAFKKVNGCTPSEYSKKHLF
jgi:AraC-like DNA-binding protein